MADGTEENKRLLQFLEALHRVASGRLKRYWRESMRFVLEPITPAEDAAWRLGGPQPGLGVCAYRTGPQRITLEGWTARVSKPLDFLGGPLLEFLGYVEVTLRKQGFAVARTSLLDLALGHVALASSSDADTRMGLQQHEEVEIVVNATRALIDHGDWLRAQDLPRLVAWIWLEGIEMQEIG